MSEITIYTKPGCPYCASAKEQMQRDGEHFTEHNVKADKAALREMLGLNGGRRQVPTIVRDGNVQVGFNGY
jgi:glutaredoxin 3